MLTIKNLTIQYGNKQVFKDISARINETDRIGLVGVNGTGKSTLLKILSGNVETDGNTVQRAKRTTVAYLPQEASALTSNLTIYQEAETSFAETLTMQRDLDAVNLELSSVDPSSSRFSTLLKLQEELQHRLEGIDIFRVRSVIEKILMGLGFKEDDFDADCSTLSGGWIMRLQLAKLLLSRPSLLMLDEPTNHLDLDSLTWLENFLLTYEGGMIIISHDRTFLDRVTSGTWDLSLGKLSIYKGNYSKYLSEKKLRLEVEKAAYENQQAQIRQTMRFVQRFRAKSTKAKQVQSRLRQLAKMDRIELSDSELDVSFKFPDATNCGRVALEVDNLTKKYGDKRIFSDIVFQLEKRDKVAVVGVNGAGKSTLMKILAGLVPEDKGEVRLGHKAKLSYFGQHQAQELTPELTVLETLAEVAGSMSSTAIRSLLGAFLFRGDEVDKKVRILSGGEKSRLALAKMIIQPANILVLDEPTNHLDMSSQEVLQEAMMQYDGAIIIVSHNRYFVNGFINKVLEIKDGEGSIYDGNIDDYLRKVEEMKEADGPFPREAQFDLQKAESKIYTEHVRGKAARKKQARVRLEKNTRTVQFKQQVQEAEKEIQVLEDEKKELEIRMADPDFYKDAEAFAESSREYKGLERRLDRQLYKWEQAQSEIEKIEAEYE